MLSFRDICHFVLSPKRNLAEKSLTESLVVGGKALLKLRQCTQLEDCFITYYYLLTIKCYNLLINLNVFYALVILAYTLIINSIIIMYLFSRHSKIFMPFIKIPFPFLTSSLVTNIYIVVSLYQNTSPLQMVVVYKH